MVSNFYRQAFVFGLFTFSLCIATEPIQISSLQEYEHIIKTKSHVVTIFYSDHYEPYKEYANELYDCVKKLPASIATLYINIEDQESQNLLQEHYETIKRNLGDKETMHPEMTVILSYQDGIMLDHKLDFVVEDSFQNRISRLSSLLIAVESRSSCIPPYNIIFQHVFLNGSSYFMREC